MGKILLKEKQKTMVKQPESLDKITKARLAFSTIGSICSIALAMFLVGVLAVMGIYSTRYIRNITENMEFEVLFFATTPQQTSLPTDTGFVSTIINKAVPEADIRNYELTLKREPFVATSRFSSRAENIEETKKILRNDFEKYTDNPINASIILTLKPEYANNQDSIEKVIQFIKQNEQVREVSYPENIAKTFSKGKDHEQKGGNLQSSLQWIIIGICGVFLFISLMLIGNSLRLNIYAKRFNIKSLLLIGATRSFVRKPFITKAIIQGVIGGAIATVLVALVIYGLNILLPDFIDTAQYTLIAILLGGVFCFSILFTTVSAFIFTNKYIKINPDRLYL